MTTKEIICKKCSTKYIVKDINLWHKQYMICPGCNVLYSPLPKTEKKLMQLQDIFLVNKSEYAFTKMYDILRAYVKSLILRHFHTRIQGDSMNYYVDNIITLFYLEYHKKENFRVISSFGAYIYHKIKEFLFGVEERETGTYYKPNKSKWSVNDISKNITKDIDWSKPTTEDYDNIIPNLTLNYIHEDGHELEIEDSNNMLEEIEKEKDKYILYNNILDIIKISLDRCSSNRERWLCTQRLSLFFNHGNNKVDAFNLKFGREGKEVFDDIIELVFNLLKDNLKR